MKSKPPSEPNGHLRVFNEHGERSIPDHGVEHILKDPDTDALTQNRVVRCIELDKRAQRQRINVTVKGGKVDLSGQVSTDRVRTHAEQLARSIEGVRDVRNFLVVEGDRE